jgi:hypothetical protein
MLWALEPDGGIAAGNFSPGQSPLEAAPTLAFENLPEGNWVSWHNPFSPQRRWLHYSRDAWRWLGWDAPAPDGQGRTRYPMACFKA